MQIITPTTTTDGSFSRASSATYYDSAGILQTAGTDVLRITYNPSNLIEPPHALLELAATNSFTRSEEIDDSSWTKVNTAVTANSTASPTTVVNADKLTENSTSNTTFAITKNLSKPSLSPISFSAFVKASERDHCILRMSEITNFAEVIFNLANGTFTTPTISGTFTNASAKIISLPNNWYRIVLMATAGTAAATTCRLGIVDASGNSTYTGVVGNGLYVWGMQAELTTAYSSYISTTTTSVPRAADVTTTNGLLYSNIAEPESGWPSWNSGTTYNIDDQVTYLHRRYKGLRATNTNHNPLTDTSSPPYWQDVGPTNRYAMFDNVIGTSTSSTSSDITVVIKNGAVEGLSLMQMNAQKVQISVTVENIVQYSVTLDLISGTILDWWEYFNSAIEQVTDYVLPDIGVSATNAVLTVKITAASGTVSIGSLIYGSVFTVTNNQTGIAVEASPTIGIIDYSLKTVDSFGNTKVLQRGYAKRMNVKMMLDSTLVDKLAAKLAAIRAIPCVYIAAKNTYKCLIVYGFYKDWDIDIAYPTKAYCSMQIEGLI